MKKIVEFQAEKGLHPDGIIGRNTLNKFKETLLLSNVQLAHFLGQLHHETGGFKHDTENLNYTVQGLINTFSYYQRNVSEAKSDGRTWYRKANQETIANKVYWDENRSRSHWLGNKNWGDGWKYRGRGAIQLTGYYNYEAFAIWMGDWDILDHPDKVAKEHYWMSAIYFFNQKELWGIAKDVSIKTISEVTKKINGGYNGLQDRIRYTQYYYQLLTKNQ